MREEHLDLLLAVLDGTVISGGLDPDFHAVIVRDAWRHAQGWHFRQLATNAAIAPEDWHRRAVMDELDRRAEKRIAA